MYPSFTCTLQLRNENKHFPNLEFGGMWNRNIGKR